jgi:hypothetical protein
VLQQVLLDAVARGLLSAVSILGPLSDDQRATFLVVALPRKQLQKLVGQLGTAPRGTRLDAFTEWELADALVDYYHDDAEVVAAVDQTLRKERGPSALAGAVADGAGAKALHDLVLTSTDPLRDLAWALLVHGPTETAELAATLVEAIIAEYDAAEERARAEVVETAVIPPAPAPGDDPAARAMEREAARALAARSRALKRAGGLKEQLVDVGARLATARGELRSERSAREHAERDAERARDDVRLLRSQLAGGAGAEVTRLATALHEAERRSRSLENELNDARTSEAALATQMRALEDRPPTTAPAAPADRASGPATWSLPLFTDEFYESIRRWDRKVVRNAFEKIHRLADDWRHPSLRAIPLEGLPGHFRIRIASDVRLIYRPLDGGRLEILSLIDREDLQRYVRTAKTRPAD